MKCTVILICAVILSFFSISDAKGCTPKEHVPQCKPCYSTCKEMKKRVTKCSRVCNYTEKCYCKPGMLKNDRGLCVPKDKCP
ncbi:unnamed protein product [Acanthoscelides obtectus]|uniref:TIL domain-containing protein n=1 Tax=Acanthoscelides obtectus TaxID=200917 RepID=A0A9P0KI21_ACAOB|nr:unnamed protein product [Acanthoscelides obtectus]CAK1625604.1 hypothetical protein AOBTE_LOCUS3264 [Acanthoscelides obtectus]